MPNSWKKLLDLLRLSVPFFVFFVMLAFGALSVSLPYVDLIKPFLIIIPLYYWSIFRPTLVPPLFCFGLGILADSLFGYPIGLNAFIFIILRWIITDQRRFLVAQPYMTVWAIFGFVCLLAGLLQWFMAGISLSQWMPLTPVLLSSLISLFLFPFMSLLLIMIHKILPVDDKAKAVA